MINKYIKKPVSIEAFILEDNNRSIRLALEFMGQRVNFDCTMDSNKFDDYCQIISREGGMTIKTLEGQHIASFGDYIIKGVKGEFYPCKPDIFKQTYYTEEEYVNL